MPIIRKINHEDKAVQETDVLKDSDEVFYCEMSNEIFRNYEDYFDRVMFLNSTVWTCALTSRPNLTYAEALDSERDARRILRQFPYELKAPLVFIASLTQRTGISELVDDIFQYVATRFFREETVSVQEGAATAGGREHWHDCEVLAVIAPEGTSAADGDPLAQTDGADIPAADPAAVRYKVRRIPDEETQPLPDPFMVVGSRVRRPRSILPKEKLKLFMKQCVECNDMGVLTVKRSIYAKCVTDGGVTTFADFWVGAAPTFCQSKWLQSRQRKEQAKLLATNGAEPAIEKKKKMGRPPKDKPKTASSKENQKPSAKPKDRKSTAKATSPNQPAISNYFAKNDGKAANNSKPAAAADVPKKAAKISKDELLRQRKLKEEAEAAAKRQLAEDRERQRAELNQLVMTAVRTHNRITEDLELPDQRRLPRPRPVRTLLPQRLLGDALFVVEFLYSFQSVLECTDKFPRGFSLALMERSLLCREVAGPLSDAIQVLLGTVFSLQLEEAAEVAVRFVSDEHFEAVPAAERTAIDGAVREASRAIAWPQKYLGVAALAELPMDANTVSELLRLHLLMSGAREDEELAKWRFHQRGGYQNVDDPGLALRVRRPHILRALAERTVYELDTADQLQILMCLVNQIVTYSTIRDTIDERFETAHRARIALRGLTAAERRREATVQTDRRAVQDEMKLKLAQFVGPAADKQRLQATLQLDVDERLRALDKRAERAREEFVAQSLTQRQDIFSYQLQLGTDRAHRSYWLFESLPGLFVARPAELLGECLAQPVEHNATLALLTSDVERNRYIKQMVTEKFAAASGDKTLETKTANGTAVSNGTAATIVDDDTDLATDLLMCTGAAESCPVHGSSNSAANAGDPDDSDDTWVYSFLHTEQELDALIAGLNARGQRERLLKEQLQTDRDLILGHLSGCNVAALQVRDAERTAGVQALYALPNYANANMGFPALTSVAEVTEGTLVDHIAELERRVTEGHLGKLQVADPAEWRAALTEARDDGQSGALRWGPAGAFNRENRVNGVPVPIDDEETETTISPATTTYIDPGHSIAADTDATDADSAKTRERVYHIARSLLQVAQAIEPQFLKPPFGASIKLKDPATIRAATERGQSALLMWQVSLMNATSHAQVFLHYTLLEDSIVWSRSTLNAVCTVCRRRHSPEKMLLCDGCNGGRHMFCCKPKITKIPDGEWFCDKCKPASKATPSKKRPITRHVFDIESGGDDDDLSSDDGNAADEEELMDDQQVYSYFEGPAIDWHPCVECEADFRRKATRLTCVVCLTHCHLTCAQPPMKKVERPWLCVTCSQLDRKQQRQLKRDHRREFTNYVARKQTEFESEDQSEDEEQVEDDSTKKSAPAKKSRSSSSAVKSTATSRKRSRSAVARKSPDADSNEEQDSDDDDDEDEEDSQPEVMPTKKARSARVSASSRKRKQSSSDDDDEEEDDEDDDADDAADNSDDDTDYEVAKPSRVKLSSRRRGQARPSAAKKKRSSSARRPAAVNGRSRANRKADSDDHDEEDDDDDDDEDNQPLVNGRMSNGRTSTSAAARRSRRAENGTGGGSDGGSDDALLDTVACYQLLKSLAKHRDAWPFERPVNRQEVPDYYVVIETPMDLAKIKSNLNLGVYTSNHAFMRDVQQIFVNCDLYNTSGSEIYNSGVNLELFVQSCCKDLHLPFQPSDMLLTELASNEELQPSTSSRSSSSSSKTTATTNNSRKSRQ